MRFWSIATAAVLASLLLAGCGSDEDSAGHGTIEGHVALFNVSDLQHIQLTVPGADAAVHASADGSYRLHVPAGTWAVYAEAPPYPRQLVGRATVAAGQTVELLPYSLTLYRPLPDFGGGTYWTMPPNFHTQAREAVVLALNPSDVGPGGPMSFYSFVPSTGLLRFISLEIEPLALSPDGTWAALQPTGLNRTVVLQNLDTAESIVIPVQGTGISSTQFTSDGTAFGFQENGTPSSFDLVQLEDGTITKFPTSRFLYLTNDRVLVRSEAAPYDWTLVRPRGSSSVAFTNVPDLATFGGDLSGTAQGAYGVEACTATPCPVDVLGPGADAAVPIEGLLASTNPPMIAAGDSGRWIVLSDGGTRVLFDTVEGRSLGALPADVADIEFSPDGGSIAFVASAGGQLFVEALPLAGPEASPDVTSEGTLRGSWISSTRYAGFDDGAATPSRFLIDAGALTVDTNYQAGSGAEGQAAVSWMDSDGKVWFQGGAGPILAAPEAHATEMPTSFSAGLRIEGGAFLPAPGERIVAGWGDGAWVLGGAETVHVATGSGGFGGILVNGWLTFSGIDGAPTFLNTDNGQVVSLFEPGLSMGVLGVDVSVADGNTVLVFPGTSSVGTPAGGGYAILPTIFGFGPP